MRVHCDRRETQQWAKSGPPMRGCSGKPLPSGEGLGRGVRRRWDALSIGPRTPPPNPPPEGEGFARPGSRRGR